MGNSDELDSEAGASGPVTAESDINTVSLTVLLKIVGILLLMRDAGRGAETLSPTVYESSEESQNCQQCFTLSSAQQTCLIFVRRLFAIFA